MTVLVVLNPFVSFFCGITECINDIVDHIDFSTHSYHDASQVDLYRIDLRDIPGFPNE